MINSLVTRQGTMRMVGTIPGSLILGVVAAIGVLTVQPLMAEQYLQASPMVSRPAVVLAADAGPEPVVGS